MRALTLLVALAATAATPAVAAEAPPPLVVTGALAAGGDLGRGSDGVAEVEVGVGWELGRGQVRPELGLVLGLSPGTYAGVRPGVHVPLPGGPFYARGALDWAREGGDWHLRWLLAGAGAELRLTSVFSWFVELDAGIPLSSSNGLGILARAGFAFRP